LAASAVEVLLEQRTRLEQQRCNAERERRSWADLDLVFATRSGTPLALGNVLRKLKLQANRAGVTEDVTLHRLRHTAATALLEEGVSIAVTSKLLRHTRLATTTDIYSHMTRRIATGAADALDARLRPLRRQLRRTYRWSRSRNRLPTDTTTLEGDQDMTVLKHRYRREDRDEVEVRVLLMDVGLCLNPSARNGDRDTIPYALADTLEMARECIEYRFVDSGEGWRNADDGGAPVRFGGEPPLDPGLVERLMDEENLKSGEVDHGEPLYFIAANPGLSVEVSYGAW